MLALKPGLRLALTAALLLLLWIWAGAALATRVDGERGPLREARLCGDRAAHTARHEGHVEDVDRAIVVDVRVRIEERAAAASAPAGLREVHVCSGGDAIAVHIGAHRRFSAVEHTSADSRNLAAFLQEVKLAA